jgi:hypothetical protein
MVCRQSPLIGRRAVSMIVSPDDWRPRTGDGEDVTIGSEVLADADPYPGPA